MPFAHRYHAQVNYQTGFVWKNTGLPPGIILKIKKLRLKEKTPVQDLFFAFFRNGKIGKFSPKNRKISQIHTRKDKKKNLKISQCLKIKSHKIWLKKETLLRGYFNFFLISILLLYKKIGEFYSRSWNLQFFISDIFLKNRKLQSR